MINYQFVKGIFVTWSAMGIKDLDIDIDKNTIFFSVPNSSYCLDAHGNEMSGKLLAKRIIKKMAEMGVDVQISYVIRNEHWTKEKDKQAYEQAKEKI